MAAAGSRVIHDYYDRTLVNDYVTLQECIQSTLNFCIMYGSLSPRGDEIKKVILPYNYRSIYCKSKNI